MYFNKQIAFKNAKNLFYTMEHEFLHVSQYSSLVGLSKAIIANVNPMLDLHAYNYEILLGNKIIANSYSREELLAFPQEYFKITSHNNYKWTKKM